MASEIFANRAELRRRLRARMGDSTDDTVATQSIDQVNELLRSAAVIVRDDCDWKRLQLEQEFSTGVDQRFYAYPSNAGPGDLVALARWDDDAKQFVPLQRRLILANLDIASTVSGTDRTALEGKPTQFEEKAQPTNDPVARPTPMIELWPIPDDVYLMKMEYTAGGAQLTDDTTPCLVDAELIIFMALSQLYEDDGREDRARSQLAQYERRRRRLSGAQRTAEVWQRGLGETIRRRFGVRYRVPPNIDTSPSVMPSP